MKTLILCSAFFTSFFIAQNNLADISDALRRGDTTALSYYMDNQVERRELCQKTKQNTYLQRRLK